MPSPVIAIVGGGPRGVSVLERIAANHEGADLDVVLVDDVEPGAGRVWRTDQPQEMRMNTLAHAVTLFTDEAVTMAGPVVSGPTLHEWSLLALAGDATGGAPASDIPHAHRDAFLEVPVRDGLVGQYRSELAAQRPESHPSRPLYGEYVRWCLAWAVQRAESRGIRVAVRKDRVLSAEPHGARDSLVLASGERVAVDAAVIAPGWLRNRRRPDDARIADAVAADPSLVWVPPGSPIEQDLDAVPAGEPAIVRGLGMGFFDAMAIVTLERGGAFVEAAGALRYVPSGREPILHVTSRRGVPYRAKSMHRGLPPACPRPHATSVDWDREPRPIDFDARLWPLLLKDAFVAYCSTLARVRPDAIDLAAALGAIAAAEGTIPRLADAVAPAIPDPQHRLDLEALLFPASGRAFSSPAEWTAWVRGFIAHDLDEAARGADSPEKAALWSISGARALASRIGAFGGFDSESRGAGFRRLFAVGGMAGSGPPAFRSRQLLALADAEIVRFLGPAATVAIDDGAFVARSPAVRGSGVRARSLVDAWMHPHDVEVSADPLLRSLAHEGRIRSFAAPSRAGEAVSTGGVDVDPATGRLVRSDGSLDETLHAAGIPLDQTMHDALISPMPGADATMLRETDRIARSLLATAIS
ncbi:FAD/NAD(P)-binding domain-containing protein [Microbacterium sp. G2-8]|uniref:FAD/NAD(P)-binding protein n=1 Tax=Microbacterium sp. G2-8 TaxID=2842454 RepID=UPI0021AAAD1C|nr:FAD/NAD(P)-binding protein [Microbacterium sp. G2-8]